MLLDQIDALSGQIDQLTARIEQTITAIPAAQPPAPATGAGGDAAATIHAGIESAASVPGHPDSDGVDPETGELLAAPLPVVDRLDEVAGIGHHAAQVIIAEVGLDMGQFPTPAHLVSWARLSPRTIQSGTKHRAGATGKGNPYLKSALGEAATAAAKTDTFLGERYRRLVRRIGKRKALVAVARSILVIVWHLLADPTARFHDLGADYHTSRIDRRPQDPQPGAPAPGARPQGHPPARRLTNNTRPTRPHQSRPGAGCHLPCRRSFSGQDGVAGSIQRAQPARLTPTRTAAKEAPGERPKRGCRG